MAAVTSAVILEPRKIRSVTVLLFPHLFAMQWWNPDTMILVFWMLSFKPAFSLYSFTFIKRLFSSSSLSAIRDLSSAYLRLLIFVLAIWFQFVLHPAQHFTWCTLHRSSISRITVYSLNVLISQFWNWEMANHFSVLALRTGMKNTALTGNIFVLMR